MLHRSAIKKHVVVTSPAVFLMDRCDAHVDDPVDSFVDAVSIES